MTFVWTQARAELRARLPAVVATILLLGLSAGVVLACLAGARRTDTALPRLEAALQTPDVIINDAWGLDPDDVRALPQVDDLASFDLFINFDAVIDGKTRSSGNKYVVSYAPRDDALGSRVLRTKLIEGRRANQDDPSEATASYTLAREFGVKVGSIVSIEFLTWGELLPVFTEGAQLPPGAGKPGIPIKIVGIDAAPGFITDLPPVGLGAGRVLLTRAFYKKYGPSAPDLVESDLSRNVYIAVQLKNGEGDRLAFEAAVRKLGGFDEAGFHSLAEHNAQTKRSLHLQAIALWALGGLGALAITLAFGQALGRQTHLDAVQHPILIGMGASPRHLFGVSMIKTLVVGCAGALVAAGVAIAMSPAFPLGLARVIEPSRGVSFDAIAIGGGIPVIIAAMALAVAVPAARAARHAAAARGTTLVSHRRARAASLMARSGFPASAIAGVRLALERGSGRSALPVRSTIVGIVIGLVGLTTALSFGASLDRLLATPALYGWNWDVTLGQDNIPDIYDGVAPILDAAPGVTAWAYGSAQDVQIDGHRHLAFAISPGKGEVLPTVIDGREPRAEDEVLVGVKVLAQLHKRIGDRVAVTGRTFEGEDSETGRTGAKATERQMTIVGSGVPVNAEAGLGYGVAMTFEGLRTLFGPDLARNMFHVRLTDPRREGAAYNDLNDRLQSVQPSHSDNDDSFPEPPSNITDFGGIRRLPLLLACVLGAAAAIMLGHVLVSSARRRRRDLAILKTIGFTTRAVRAAVAWQASTLVVVASIIAVPLGAIAGRWVWTLLATALGIGAQPVVPGLAFALIAPAALILGNLLAAMPARIAARAEPAITLRAE
jgi:ABC-type lipoprotein release transport system permease subunit